MDAVLICSLCVNIALIVERAFKYYLKHVKKSRCCGTEMETRDNSPEKDTKVIDIDNL